MDTQNTTTTESAIVTGGDATTGTAIVPVPAPDNADQPDQGQAGLQEPAQDNEAITVGPVQFVDLPLHFLRAALTCVSTEETRYYLNGLFLHRVEDRLRVVSTDGHRLFVASHLPAGVEENGWPEWTEAGVTVAAENLAAKLTLVAKLSDSPVVRIGYGTGSGRAVVCDTAEEATFRCSMIDGQFPDYRAVLASLTGGVTEAKDVERTDFTPVSFAGSYIKAVGDMAKILGGKDATVSVYASQADEAAIMTFPDAPGAMLVLMPKRADGPVNRETVALMAPAVKGTLAALRAHLKRNQTAAAEATDATEKAAFETKAAEYEKRIADLLARTLEQTALPAPAAPIAEAPQADAPEAEAPKSDGAIPFGTDDGQPAAGGEDDGTTGDDAVTDSQPQVETQGELPIAAEDPAATTDANPGSVETTETEAPAATPTTSEPVGRKARRAARKAAEQATQAAA